MPDPVARLNSALEGLYHVEREVGQGGMATVYLADDLRHGRSVALKVLKPELAAVVGAERFLAEIKTTAGLQHPHILPLFDSGEADGFLFYVMPYVEGDTLADWIRREKQLPVDEAVRIATAVANALDHAHRNGVVHRDIKPANILMQENEPVVADFGIALAVGVAGGSRLTETGLSLGTPYYMSPEQATGDQTVGPASDTYALACVLYEMLTGDPPYVGSTAQAVLGKIIAGAATAPTQLRPSIPANVDAALRRALEKLPADRFASAHDFSRALNEPSYRYGESAHDAATAATGRWKVLAGVFAATTALLTAALGLSMARSEPPAGVLRYSLPVPSGLGGGSPFGPNIDISRDGTKIVTADGREGEARLWLRERAELEARPVRGTDGARQPFFSPDGQRVGFIDGSRRLRIAALGGQPPLTLLDDGVTRSGGSWGEDGYIYFTAGSTVGGLAFTEGIARVADVGGPLEIVSRLDSANAEVGHLFPDALPSGRGVLFTVAIDRLYSPETTAIGVADLSTGEHRILLEGVHARWSPTGHVLVVRSDGALIAAPFDDQTLEITGPAVPLLEGVDTRGLGSADLAVSRTGTLVYVGGASQAQIRQLVWVTRSGESREIDPSQQRVFELPRLSPDGTRLAVEIQESSERQIWVKELDEGPLAKFTFQGTVSGRVNWHPSGETLVYRSIRGDGNGDIYSRPADGSAQESLLIDEELPLEEVIYSPDGEWMVYRLGSDLYARRTESDEAPVPLATSPTFEGHPAISPDGRWIALISDASGTAEVFVHPFPNVADARWQVSTDGGEQPAWAHSGRELFYWSPDGEMIAVEVRPGDTFVAGERRTLFSIQGYAGVGGFSRAYDVAPDDQRFVMVRAFSPGEGGQVVVVEGFFEELERLAGN